jgi:hypothetical protein
MADESKQPKAYRVLSVERSEEDGSGGYEVFLAPIYYGPDEEGPKVGDVLVPGEVKD